MEKRRGRGLGGDEEGSEMRRVRCGLYVLGEVLIRCEGDGEVVGEIVELFVWMGRERKLLGMWGGGCEDCLRDEFMRYKGMNRLGKVSKMVDRINGVWGLDRRDGMIGRVDLVVVDRVEVDEEGRGEEKMLWLKWEEMVEGGIMEEIGRVVGRCGIWVMGGDRGVGNIREGGEE